MDRNRPEPPREERVRGMTDADRRAQQGPESEVNPLDEEKVEIVRQFFKDALKAERKH